MSVRKYIISSLLLIVMMITCHSCCYWRSRFFERNNNIAKMMHCHSDTVYKYYSETWGKNRMLDVRCFWYHKNNNIHLYVLQEGKAMRYKKIPAINYAVNDTIDEYKMVTMAENRYGECFEATLDGEGIFVYIKKRKNVDISVNSNCLSKKKCKEGTFEYKLQYDLPRVMKYIKYD